MTSLTTYAGRHRQPPDPDPDPGPAEQPPGSPPPPGTTPADQAAWTTAPDPGQDQPSQPDPATSPTSGGRGGTGPARTRASTLERLSRDGLTDAAEHAFRGAGELLNTACAEDRPPEADPDDIWLPTDDEAEGVAEPAGRLLARRIPDPVDGDPNDIADLITLAIPLGIWAFRGLAEWVPRVLRRRRKTAVIQGRAEAPPS